MEKLRIGLLGLAFHSGNLGCSALSYSFLNMLAEIAKKRRIVLEIKIILPSDNRQPLLVEYENVSYSFVRLGIIKTNFRKETLEAISICDIIFDFTAGDSFTDIYGKKRFIKHTLIKEFVLFKHTPLVLGSQTYGPYNHYLCRLWAAHVMKKSTAIFARDEISQEFASKLSKREVALTPDVAFFLPYKKKLFEDEKVHIGLNPSGLLWHGGYTKDNQFGLSVDYREYINQILSILTMDERYVVHLVPHVVYKDNPQVVDNDWFLCKELKEKYPVCELSQFFESPMEAKSYISGLDLFIGARMHATIAAYSSGVPTIAFSYSRKFEGLFDSLKYPYVLSGKELNTEEAISKTLEWLNDVDNMKEMQKQFASSLESRKSEMKSDIEKLLLNRLKKKKGH